MDYFDNYIREYAKYFDLLYGDFVCYNKYGDKVLYLNHDKTVSYRESKEKWLLCKQGDLLVSIINNIPIHS